MMRKPDWRDQLQVIVSAYRNEPWTWGESDCAHFVADCILAMTGVEILGTFRNNFSSRLSCAARLRAKGYRSVEQWAEATFANFGCPEGIPACSQVGDAGITSEGIMCIRLAQGFVARTESGQFAIVKPARSWCVAWEGA